MLILSRRPGDAIVIDGGIRIVVLASGQRCVRLGIEAPAQVGIVREEVLARAEGRIEGNGQSAGKDGADSADTSGTRKTNGKSAGNGH
ncbi:MAG: carbon storage regulator [Gemmatimonadota bacterium]|jgi:carbon storage regulator